MTKLRKQEYLNLERAAKLLGVSYRSLKRMIENGKIPCRQLGERTYRISRRELDQHIRQKRMDEMRIYAGDASRRDGVEAPGWTETTEAEDDAPEENARTAGEW